MKNTYFFDLDGSSGIVISHVSLEYENEVEQYNLKIASGDKVRFIELYPEELADIYNGVYSDYLRHRIRYNMSEMTS
jgi:hypothetical protein